MPQLKQGFRNIKEDYFDGSHWLLRGLAVVLVIYLLVASVLGFY
jgi:hypothetical protein